jgi:hypothetical protein
LIAVVNFYYFATLFYFNIKINNFLKQNQFKINQYKKVSLSGYPFVPAAKIKKIIIQSSKNNFNFKLFDVKIDSYFNNFKISVEKITTSNSLIDTEELDETIITPIKPINLTINMTPQGSKIDIQSNFLNILNPESSIGQAKQISIQFDTISVKYQKNIDFEKTSCLAHFVALYNQEKLLETHIDADKITKFNDKSKVTDIYQINNLKIVNNAELTAQGIIFFHQINPMPVVNLDILIKKHYALLDRMQDYTQKSLKTEKTNKENLETLQNAIELYKKHLIPMLKQNEIIKTQKDELSIRINNRGEVTYINNMSIQEIALALSKYIIPKNKQISDIYNSK